MSFAMNWKSTAVISGVGVLATWVGLTPVVHSPVANNTSQPALQAPETTGAAVDIQQEAARLTVRLHQTAAFSEPSRNPFRFGQRPAPAARPSGGAPVQPAAVVPPPAPPITLDGIASDMVGDQEQRTAILKTESGVVLVREGEQVAGYQVAKIGTDAVELLKLDDGSSLRIALR